nr:retrovirus-related Pol polyprotein from transposon TNT 1-94 [Tanacetum cinerariifolium]
MLEKTTYDSWKSRMDQYIENKENEIMILNSVEHSHLIWPTVEENSETRKKKYEELSALEKLQADCEGHIASQCTKPKRPKNSAWYQENMLLVQAQESKEILDEEQLAFLVDPWIPEAKAVLMANLLNYDSDVLSELSEDFAKRFVSQQELSAKQAFWLQTSNPNNEQSHTSHVKIKAPRELPKEAQIYYLKTTKKQADILHGIVEQARAKQPLDSALDFACCLDCSLVSGLRMLQAYYKEPLSAHQLCLQISRYCKIRQRSNSKDYRLWRLSAGKCYDLLGKSKKHSFKPKAKDFIQEKLYRLHMDLYGPMRFQSINGKKYILVIVDDYSQFTWAVVTACYTQNQSLIRKLHNKTPYKLLHSKKPDLLYLHVSGALCYPTNDSDDLGKLQPKADIRIFIGYAPAKKAFWIYNKRTHMIIEIIHVYFDELKAMATKQFSLGPES